MELKKIPLALLVASATQILNTTMAIAPPQWKASLKSDTFSNYTDDANVLSAGLNARGGIELTQDLSLEGEIGLGWRTGRAQSWYGYDANKDGIHFSDAYVKYQPSKLFSLKAGAISSNYLNTPTLITATFPGIKESFTIENKGVSVEINALQAIPTSSSLNISRSEKEELPKFFSENVKAQYSNKKFESSVSIGHFIFKDLPATVAYQSSFLGNNTYGSYESDSKFLFGFSGYTVTADAKYNFAPTLSIRAGIERVENLDANYGYGRGQVVKLESDIHIGDNVLTPSAELFFAESDCAPAYYNTSRYGNTNREGYSLGLSYKLNKKGFKVSAVFADADLIDNKDLVNSREQYIFLKLETLYKQF